MKPTPAELADIDQKCSQLGDVLDGIVPIIGQAIGDVGPERAAVHAATSLARHVTDPAAMASLLGVALVRIAQSTQEGQ